MMLVILFSNQANYPTEPPKFKFSPKKSIVSEGRRYQKSNFFTRTSPATPEGNRAQVAFASNQYSGPLGITPNFGHQAGFLPNFIGGK